MSEQPYGPYLGRVMASVQRRLEAEPPMGSPHAGAPMTLADRVEKAAEVHADELVALSHDLHAHPELCYEEHHAAAAIAALLRRHGHEVEVGAYGLPTALRARVGAGRPRVAVLAEYDALPDLGHACGHNVIAATAVGALLGVAAVADELDGSVELIGTPAEEGGGGKELIARAGGFDEVDAAVMIHPFGADIADHPFIGVRTVAITFTGVAAHASAWPFLGRNALDAAVQTYTGVAQLRQHMLPSDRVHGIFTDGGRKPNIVPDRAALELYVRSAEPDTLAVLCDRVGAIAEGAARQAGVDVAFEWDLTPVYLPTRLNGPLTARYAVNAGRRGRKVIPKGILPEAMTGSTDLGNVSVRVPAVHAMLGIAPITVPIHSVEFARHAIGPEADRGVVDGAVGLALTALDYLTDPELREAVRADFEAAGGAATPEELLS